MYTQRNLALFRSAPPKLNYFITMLPRNSGYAHVAGNHAKKTPRSTANKSVRGAEKRMMFEHTIRFPNKRASLVRAALWGVYCKRDNWDRCLLFVLGEVELSDWEYRTLMSFRALAIRECSRWDGNTQVEAKASGGNAMTKVLILNLFFFYITLIVLLNK